MGNRRVDIVIEHGRLEHDHDFPTCIGKFGRARYEVVAGHELFDGEGRVEHFLRENKRLGHPVTIVRGLLRAVVTRVRR